MSSVASGTAWRLFVAPRHRFSSSSERLHRVGSSTPSASERAASSSSSLPPLERPSCTRRWALPGSSHVRRRASDALRSSSSPDATSVTSCRDAPHSEVGSGSPGPRSAPGSAAGSRRSLASSKQIWMTESWSFSPCSRACPAISCSARAARPRAAASAPAGAAPTTSSLPEPCAPYAMTHPWPPPHACFTGASAARPYTSSGVDDVGSTASNVLEKRICAPRCTHTRRSLGWQRTISGCPGDACGEHRTATAIC